MIEVYAIAEHPGPPLPRSAAVRAVAEGRLEALCGPAADGEPSAEALWRHERVVEALMEHRDVLPVRFGTPFEDDETTARVLAERQRELLAALARVRGAAELSLRILGTQPAGPAPVAGTSGAEYLRAKIRAAAARGETARGVHAPLARLARASSERAPRQPGELVRAAYLVDRRGILAFGEAVADLQREHPHLRLVCTGPWPPFSFVGQ